MTIHKDVRSFRYCGEQDQYSIITADILYYSRRFFPRKLLISPKSSDIVEVEFDIIERRDLLNRMWANVTEVKGGQDRLTPTALPFNAHAWFDGEKYWILINHGLVRGCVEFVSELFGYEEFRKELQLDTLDEEQLLLLEMSCSRMAIEIAIGHENGHIFLGHADPRVRSLSTALGLSGLTPDAAQRNDFLLARELAADDAAATNLAMRAVHGQYWTFSLEQRLLERGENTRHVVTFLGYVIFFYLQSISDSLEVEFYPKLDVRLRYFYMTMSDAFNHLDPQSSVGMNRYWAMSKVLAAFRAVSAVRHERKASKICEALEWLDDMDKESEVLERVQQDYDKYKRYSPVYEPFQLYSRGQ